MQSPSSHDLDWNVLLGIGNQGTDEGDSPQSNRGSDQSPAHHSLDSPQSRARQRNRNPRSCDFCRVRKTACVIREGPPCIACKSRNLRCTFAKPRRGKRQDPGQAVAAGLVDHLEASGNGDSSLDLNNLQPESPAAPAEFSMPWQLPPDSPSGLLGQQGFGGTQFPIESGLEQHDPAAQVSPELAKEADTPDKPLDWPPWTFMLLGDCGEADPHLLKRSSLAAHADKVRFRRLHRDQRDLDSGHDLDRQRPLVFMIGSENLYDKYEPRLEEDVLRNIRLELGRISSTVGIRLVKLYFRFIYPYFPVLSRSRMLQDYGLAEDAVSGLSLSLKAALYASALPYMVYDDVLSTMLDLDLPTAKTLYRMCWTAISHEIHSPRLSTMQACLLLLQRDNVDRYVQGSPFQWSLMAWAVSLAQTLGLSTDCSTMRGIPTWEKRLRKRLWWATYVLDKWNFALAGLTSHIKEEDYDVLPLTSADFVSDGKGSNTFSPDPPPGPTHFQRLVELSLILANTISAFFTIRASRTSTNNFAYTYQLATNLQLELDNWKTSLDQYVAIQAIGPPARTRLDGTASLHLAYWALRLLVLRALLRSLESSTGTPEDKQLREEYRDSVRRNAAFCCEEVVNFVENLAPGAWNAFWHKFSPSNFAIVSSIMMRLLFTSNSPSETRRLNELIERWRWVLRCGGGNVGNDLMGLGLLRLDRTLMSSRAGDTSC